MMSCSLLADVAEIVIANVKCSFLAVIYFITKTKMMEKSKKN